MRTVFDLAALSLIGWLLIAEAILLLVWVLR